jgi:hypothetical protein
MTTSGQRRNAETTARLEKLQFYDDCLTNVERSKLAARYLRKVPRKHRAFLLRTCTIAQLDFCEVFSKESYRWE